MAGGAQTKYTKKRVEAIVERVRQGVFVKTACRVEGVSPQTFYRWMETRPYIREQIDAARAYAETTAIRNIRTAAERGDWRADAWFLERAFRDKYGQQAVELKHSGKVETNRSDQILNLILASPTAIRLAQELSRELVAGNARDDGALPDERQVALGESSAEA